MCVSVSMKVSRTLSLAVFALPGGRVAAHPKLEVPALLPLRPSVALR